VEEVEDPDDRSVREDTEGAEVEGAEVEAPDVEAVEGADPSQ
jgi:hypothetical protein